MTGFRFSIAKMLLAVAFIGGALGALQAQSPTLAGLMTLATVGVILVAVLGSVFCTGRARCFWLGLALFGGAYFVIVFTPIAPAAKSEIEAPLKAFRRRFWGVVVTGNTQPQPPAMGWYFDRATQQRIALPDWGYAFGTTLHCIANLLFALCGGIVGWWLFGRRHDLGNVHAPSQKRQANVGPSDAPNIS